MDDYLTLFSRLSVKKKVRQDSEETILTFVHPDGTEVKDTPKEEIALIEPDIN